MPHMSYTLGEDASHPNWLSKYAYVFMARQEGCNQAEGCHEDVPMYIQWGCQLGGATL